jgi:hypothetical protein
MMPLMIKATMTEPTAVATGSHRGISSTRFSNITLKGKTFAMRPVVTAISASSVAVISGQYAVISKA